MKIRPFLALLSLVGIAACGGGSDGAPTPTQTSSTQTQFDITKASNNILQTTATYSANGTFNGDSYSVTYSVAPQADSTFQGLQVKRSKVTVLIRQNGALAGSSETDVYYEEQPWRIVGQVRSDRYVESIMADAIPTSAVAPFAKRVYSSEIYNNQSKSQIIGTEVFNFILEPDSTSIAFACFGFEGKDTSGITQITETNCFRSDPSGNISGFKATVSFSNGNGGFNTINFQ